MNPRLILSSIVLVCALVLTGCDKDSKKAGHSKPPTEKPAEKVPDAPSSLQLSAVAIVAVAAYRILGKERAS